MIQPRHIVIAAITACALLPAGSCHGAAFAGKYTRMITQVQGMEARKILGMADSCARLGLADSALVLYMAAAERAADNPGGNGMEQGAYARLKAGDIYFGKGDYASALESYVEGMKVSERSSRGDYEALLFKNIGRAYCMFGDYEKGYEYYRKGYDACIKHNNEDTRRRLLINLTGLCLHTGKTAEAEKWHSEAVRMKNAADPENMFMIKLNQGMIWAARGERRKAVDCFKRLAEAEGRAAGTKYVCSAYQQAYMTYMDAGQADSALTYIDKCWRTACDGGIRHMFIETLKDYSSIYAQKGATALSQEYKALYLDLSDSIFNTRKFDMARNAQTRYEMQKADREIAELNYKQRSREQTIAYQRVMLGAAAAAAAVTAFFLIVTLRQKRKLKRSYTDLYALNRSLMDSREELKANRTGNGEDNAHKYKSSSLNDEGRRALVAAITAVMENGEEFCSAYFSLERLAQLVGSNSKYVSQVINDTFNKNFRAYVNDYRVNLARHRLADSEHYGNYTTKAIGESLGFSSHASFINVFRNATGLTPSQYQKMSLQERPSADGATA